MDIFVSYREGLELRVSIRIQGFESVNLVEAFPVMALLPQFPEPFSRALGPVGPGFPLSRLSSSRFMMSDARGVDEDEPGAVKVGTRGFPM